MNTRNLKGEIHEIDDEIANLQSTLLNQTNKNTQQFDKSTMSI